MLSKKHGVLALGALLGLASQLLWLWEHEWDVTWPARLAAGPIVGGAAGWLALVFHNDRILRRKVLTVLLNLFFYAAAANYALAFWPDQIPLGGGWHLGGKPYGFPALYFAASLWLQHLALGFGWAFRQHLHAMLVWDKCLDLAKGLSLRLGSRLPTWLKEALTDIALFWILPRATLLVITKLAADFFLARLKLGPEIPRLADPVWGFLMRFDAWYYHDIARTLYADKADKFAFFPLYPLLSKGLSLLTGWPVYVSGIVIANSAVMAALLFLYKTYRQDLGRQPLTVAVILLAVWPSSIFFSSFYTESLYLLLAVVSFYFFRRGSLAASGFSGALLSATRPTGLALLPAFALDAMLGRRRFSWRLLWLLVMPAGVGGYSLYCYLHTGDPLFFSAIQKNWGRSFTPPWSVFLDHFSSMVNHNLLANEVDFAFMLDMLFAILALALVPLVWRRLGAAEALFVLGTLVLTFASGSTRSLTRFTLTLFPLFLVLGQMLAHRWRAMLLIVMLLMTVSVFTSVEFAAWMWTW